MSFTTIFNGYISRLICFDFFNKPIFMFSSAKEKPLYIILSLYRPIGARRLHSPSSPLDKSTNEILSRSKLHLTFDMPLPF